MHAGDPATAAPLRVAGPALPPLAEYADRLSGAWDRAHLSNFGPEASAFEAACAEYGGLREPLAVANCDLGLALALRALELPAGAEVVLPSFTFASTLHAVLWNGLAPRFADVDPATWCLTAATAQAAVTPRTAAIAGTHAFRSACDVAGLEALAAHTGAKLVFDAAQAFASWHGDRHAGTFGDASVFSFSATKIATAGEGGLAVFRDPAAAERFRLLRAYGSDRDYDSLQIGLNAKLSELHAVLGCLTVARVEDEVTAREALVARYRERLAGAVTLQEVPAGVRATPTQFVVLVRGSRDAVAETLRADGIETRPYFRPLHAMPRFAGLSRAPLGVTEALGARSLALPLHSAMGAEDVDRVCDALLAVA